MNKYSRSIYYVSKELHGRWGKMNMSKSPAWKGLQSRREDKNERNLWPEGRHSDGRPGEPDMNTEEKVGRGGGTGEREMAFEGGLEGSGNTTLGGGGGGRK